MQATKDREPILRRAPSHPVYVNNDGLSPKKTAFIIVTVIGCIAILWPKVFYPMMFGGRPPVDIHKASNIKEQKGPSLGCCFNATPYFIGPQEYRKQLNLFTGEISLRQERPAHLHPDSVYQAMRERGRAIPATPTIPIVDRQGSANKPRFVEGRPGPIPGLRPPMGAGSIHQPQAKGNSMGFIMPLYTIGIVIFFGYTIMKLVFKKQAANTPYPSSSRDPLFRKEVFGQENGRHTDDRSDKKLVVTAIQGLIDAADEQLKKREPKATSEKKKNPDEHSTSNIADISSEHKEQSIENDAVTENHANLERKQRGGSSDRSVTILGMELTASCEGGKKWKGRPPTPVFPYHSEHSDKNGEDNPEPRSIYLEGKLSHKSQILISDSETKTENFSESEDSTEEPAVVLSSKMTLSLINMNQHDQQKKEDQEDLDSPLADDIEIISPYDQ